MSLEPTMSTPVPCGLRFSARRFRTSALSWSPGCHQVRRRLVREDLRDAVFRDVALLASVGVEPVVVHGGGPEINQWLNRLSIEPVFQEGLRNTCPDTMDVVEMVLVQRVNKQIVNGLNRVGGRAVGLSGADGGLVRPAPTATAHWGWWVM